MAATNEREALTARIDVLGSSELHQLEKKTIEKYIRETLDNDTLTEKQRKKRRKSLDLSMTLFRDAEEYKELEAKIEEEETSTEKDSKKATISKIVSGLDRFMSQRPTALMQTKGFPPIGSSTEMPRLSLSQTETKKLKWSLPDAFDKQHFDKMEPTRLEFVSQIIPDEQPEIFEDASGPNINRFFEPVDTQSEASSSQESPDIVKTLELLSFTADNWQARCQFPASESLVPHIGLVQTRPNHGKSKLLASHTRNWNSSYFVPTPVESETPKKFKTLEELHDRLRYLRLTNNKCQEREISHYIEQHYRSALPQARKDFLKSAHLHLDYAIRNENSQFPNTDVRSSVITNSKYIAKIHGRREKLATKLHEIQDPEHTKLIARFLAKTDPPLTCITYPHARKSYKTKRKERVSEIKTDSIAPHSKIQRRRTEITEILTQHESRTDVWGIRIHDMATALLKRFDAPITTIDLQHLMGAFWGALATASVAKNMKPVSQYSCDPTRDFINELMARHDFEAEFYALVAPQSNQTLDAPLS